MKCIETAEQELTHPNARSLHAPRAPQVSGTVFSILANVDQFYQYNYRENFMHAEGGEAAAPEA